MGFFTIIEFVVVIVVVGAVISFDAAIVSGLLGFPIANATQAAEIQYGHINPKMMCPHCNVVGKVRTRSVTQKKGISGGKATAAVVTAGISMLATGLSRKESMTQAHCTNCKNTWFF